MEENPLFLAGVFRVEVCNFFQMVQQKQKACSTEGGNQARWERGKAGKLFIGEYKVKDMNMHCSFDFSVGSKIFNVKLEKINQNATMSNPLKMEN